MHKLLCTVIVATSVGFSVPASFAAGTMKLEELTKDQRIEMRNRADSLIAERAAKASARHSPNVKKPANPKTDSRS